MSCWKRPINPFHRPPTSALRYFLLLIPRPRSIKNALCTLLPAPARCGYATGIVISAFLHQMAKWSDHRFAPSSPGIFCFLRRVEYTIHRSLGSNQPQDVAMRLKIMPEKPNIVDSQEILSILASRAMAFARGSWRSSRPGHHPLGLHRRHFLGVLRRGTRDWSRLERRVSALNALLPGFFMSRRSGPNTIRIIAPGRRSMPRRLAMIRTALAPANEDGSPLSESDLESFARSKHERAASFLRNSRSGGEWVARSI